MSLTKVFNYPDIEKYPFEERPKGSVIEISINAYTGDVYVKLDKHLTSEEIAYDLMKLVIQISEKEAKRNVRASVESLVSGNSKGVLRRLSGCSLIYRYDRKEKRNVG